MGAGTAYPWRPNLSCAVPTRSFASAWMCDRVGTALCLRAWKRMRAWPAPLPTLQGDARSPRQRQLETHHALELAFGLPARMRVDLGLALLAQIAGGELRQRAAFDRLLATLLDEGAEDRCLAVLGRQVDTVPALTAIARIEEVAQQVGFLAIARGVARIADDADALENAVVVEACGEHDREIKHLGARELSDLGRELVGLGPIFELVVIAEIDLAQAAGLGTAALEVAPAGERRRGRPAAGATGVVGELVGKIGDRSAELEVPDLEPVRPLLGGHVRRAEEQCHGCQHARHARPWAGHPRLAFCCST